MLSSALAFRIASPNLDALFGPILPSLILIGLLFCPWLRLPQTDLGANQPLGLNYHERSLAHHPGPPDRRRRSLREQGIGPGSHDQDPAA